MKILAIIPARSGSKGIKNKNIKLFKGQPLLVWSIKQALNSRYKMRIIVSTDSQKYADIAKKNGAEVPFLRPDEISGDYSTDFEFIKHCTDFLKENENYFPDIILQLRPTQPLRKIKDIDNCLDIFIKNRDKYDSLRTVIPVEKSPYKMYNIQDNVLVPLFNKVNNINEPFNRGRQELPNCYLHNGYIDILNADLINKNTISGNKIYPYLMDIDENIDIDEEKDFINAENEKLD